MICDLCYKKYVNIFDSTLRIDYTMPGKGKLHEYHMCQSCRKNILDWLESNSKKNKRGEEKCLDMEAEDLVEVDKEV